MRGTGYRVRPHAFEDDPGLCDPWRPVLRWCGRCGLPGEPGDDRHPPEAEAAARLLAEAAEVDRRRTGEHEYEDSLSEM